MAMTENTPRAYFGDRNILFLLFFQRLGWGVFCPGRGAPTSVSGSRRIPNNRQKLTKGKWKAFLQPGTAVSKSRKNTVKTNDYLGRFEN
jgi:hypothetical protein